MKLRASIPLYKEIEINLTPTRTIKEFKQIACRKLGIEPDLTRCLLRGKQLTETSTVSSLRTVKGPVVLDYLWARQLLVWGAEGQQKIRNATVLLAGAGAIGNEAAKNLAMLGVGKIIIVDRDRIELSNISRMIFFQPRDLGKNKAEFLAKNIHLKYPFVTTTAYRGNLENMPLKLYLDSKVVLCGLDNVVSRIFLTQTCRKYSIPLIDAGITGLNGRVHSYLPPDDACPICMFPPNQYSTIAGLRNPCEAPLEQETVPSFATSISLVSSILAQETIKVILGLEEYKSTKKWPEKTGQPLRAILFVDLKNNRYSTMELKRSERCIVCGKDGTGRDLVSRNDLPLPTLHTSKTTVEGAIRKASNLIDGELTIFAETSDGTRKIDGKSLLRRAGKRGDYLRVLAEGKNQELHESILRLS
ncbi:MAG: ThiF family adenylyltransferase [Candidatus Bathyarchaeia archaeon]|jgi:molybdopterin/thiamine biosynthesis adenylyltransferase